MEVKEFGTENEKKIMLIPGNLMSWRQFKTLIPHLSDEYHVIAISTDGYDDTGRTTFTTAKNSADNVAEYVKENLDGHIHLVFGESMGCATAMMMFRDQKVLVDSMILNGGQNMDIGPFNKLLLKIIPNGQYKMYKMYQENGQMGDFPLIAKLYIRQNNEQLKEMFESIAMNISYESIYNASIEALRLYRSMKDTKAVEDAHVGFWHGSKEPNMKKAWKQVKNIYPQATELAFEGMGHGEILKHPETLARSIKDFMKVGSNIKLGDVEETALIPLAVRANETKSKTARITDNAAVEIIDMLGIDTKNLDKTVTHESVVARTILFDNTVKKLIRKYPDAVCVNLGCGLDDRFSRVDNGMIQWYNIDLPDSIEVRKKIFAKSEREHMIGANLLENDWLIPIPKDKVTIVVAEGLFMYFTREQTEEILRKITENFPKGYLVVELMRQSMMKEKVHDTVKHTNAKFGWGTDSGEELLSLNAKLELLKETSFSAQMKKSSLKSRLLGTMIGNLNNRLAVYRWR